MSTLILNPNDTILLKDTIVVKFAEVAEKCHPIVIKGETNCNDVTIVAIICGAIIILAIIAAIVITLWHYMEVKKWREIETGKATNDLEMRKNDALLKEREEWNRLLRYFQKSVFDKIIAKKIEEKNITKEEDWKNLHKKLVDFVNDIFVKFKA